MASIPPDRIQSAIKAIRKDLREADNVWFRDMMSSAHNDYGDGFDVKRATYSLESAWLTLIGLAECCDQPSIVTRAKSQFREAQEDPLKSEMGPEEPYLVWSGEAYQLLKVLERLHVPPLSRAKAKQEIREVEGIIRAAQVTLVDTGLYGWLPTEEADVHNRLESILQCHHPSLVSKPPLKKEIKSFIPDTGIPDLELLIEYKFLESKKEAAAFVDQVLADLGGYRDPDYAHVLFVFYEISRIYTEDRWKRQIARAKASMKTSVIVLHGVPYSDADVAARTEALKRQKEQREARKKSSTRASGKKTATKKTAKKKPAKKATK